MTRVEQFRQSVTIKILDFAPPPPTIVIISKMSQSNLFLQADNLDFAAAFSRIECHYFVNG